MEAHLLLARCFLEGGLGSTAIEQTGFPKDELETFAKAVHFCGGERGFPSPDPRRLLDGLGEGKFLTSMIADVVRRRT